MPALTNLKIKSAPPGRHSDSGRDGVRGLMLVVMPPGKRGEVGGRSFVLRMQRQGFNGGKRIDLGLGGWPDLELGAAREKARLWRREILDGRDPRVSLKVNTMVVPTFAEAAQATYDAQKEGWRDRTAQGFLSLLETYAYPLIGKMRVDQVTNNDIVSTVAPIWNTKPATARKVRTWVVFVLNFAHENNWRPHGAPKINWKIRLGPLAAGTNFAAMPYDKVPAFVAGLRGKAETVGRLALMFTILTAARSGEVRSLRWSHLDLQGGWWHRPAELMKGKEAHSVTLSKPAIAILKRMELMRVGQGDPFVFPGTGGRMISDMTMSKYVKGHEATVHGFRSSFRDWAAEQCPTVPDAVAEEALAHKIGNETTRAYRRTKLDAMRRDLLEAWGRYVDGEAAPLLRLVG